MANKQINELSSLSTMANDDLLLVYDVDEVSSEKTKNITYADFETQISGSLGGGGGGSNPESLYYNGTDVKATAIAEGIIVTNGTATGFTIGYSGDDIYLVNTDPDGQIFIQARNSGDTQTNNLFTGDPDAASQMYHAGASAIKTSTFGMQVLQGSNTLDIGYSGGWEINSSVHAATIKIKGEDTGGTDRDMILGDPDGAVELYHSGIIAMATDNTGGASGISLHDTTGTKIAQMLVNSANDLYLKAVETSGRIVLIGEDSTDTEQTLFIGDPDGAADLYYAGVKAFETTVAGITIYNATGHLSTIGNISSSNNDIQWKNWSAGGNLNITLEKAASGQSTVMTANPDGTTDLYHSGTYVLGTDKTGGGNYGLDIQNAIWIINDTSTNEMLIFSRINSNTLKISGFNASASATSMIIADPDGATELYHAGGKQLETTVSGISVTNGQIKFPATQNPSSDVNTLDDYEEGTWTPTAADATSGGNTSTTGSGWYTKIGRQVHVVGKVIDIDTTGFTGGNNFFLQDLPFTNNATFTHTGSCRVNNITYSGDSLVCGIRTNESSVLFFYSTSASNLTPVICSNISDDATDVYFDLTYFV